MAKAVIQELFKQFNEKYYLTTYIIAHDFFGEECKLLEDKYNSNFSGFKVTINLDDLERTKKSDYWPVGTVFFSFFHPRKQKAPPN